MPIKLKCNCGQVLNVPDSLAGKTGKCPKCQAALRIPAAAATATAQPATQAVAKPAAAKPTAAKPASAKPVAAKSAQPVAKQAPVAAASSGMDDLLDEIGLTKKTGPVCPKCGGSIQRNAALCTHCGYNLQSGEQAVGFEARIEREEFKNPFLQEAANNMHAEVLSEERHAKAGTPWWMLISFLLGALCIGAAGVIIVDATMNEPAEESTFLGKLQREKFGVVAGVTFAAVGSVIAFFAHMSIVIFAFSKTVGLGFATLLIPFYNMFYGIKTWADNKSGIYGLIIGGIVAGFGFWLNAYSGGVRGYYF